MYILVMLLSFIFETYLFVLLLRLLLQKLGANWGNPFSQLVVKLTEPVVKPLRRFIPGFKGFDLAIVVVVLVIQTIETLIILGIKVGTMPGIFGSFVISLGYIGNKFVSIYVWGVILSVVMSWVPALQHNPLASVISTIVDPVLDLGRRFIPRIAGLDLSPIPILLLLWIIRLLLFQSIIVYGFRLAY